MDHSSFSWWIRHHGDLLPLAPSPIQHIRVSRLYLRLNHIVCRRMGFSSRHINKCSFLIHPIYRYRRIEWQCDVDNYCGKKVADRLGFTLEGVLRKHRIWRDANRDTSLYAMTNSDWRDPVEDRLALLVKERLQRGLGNSVVGRSLLKEMDLKKTE